MPPSPPPVGLIGLVGQAIAHRLQAAGIATLGYDLRAEAREAFAAQGFAAASTSKEIGSTSPNVVLAVFDTADVIDSVEGADGLLASAEPQTTLLIDCSTGDPDLLQALSARLAARGVAFVEAPLSGSSEQIAAEAKGRMMVEERFAPQSRIRQHLKDVDLMLAAAAIHGQGLPLSQTHAALMRAAVAAGDGELDNAAIVRQLRRERTPPTSS